MDYSSDLFGHTICSPNRAKIFTIYDIFIEKHPQNQIKSGGGIGDILCNDGYPCIRKEGPRGFRKKASRMRLNE
jgi:hypothetical protein